jgi:MoaA/NifB/PqqE/SkfB family radical SAM enzyme
MEKRQERIPINGTFELTARCNLCCEMCLIRIDHQKMQELGGRERTAVEWISMAEELSRAGTIGLLLTGGEPMLRPDFSRIYEAIAQMGFMITVYTNATLITNEVMEVFKRLPPHRIGITIYGASPDTYQKVTGSADAYNHMLKGVRQLRQLPSKISFRTTLVKDNYLDLTEIEELVYTIDKNAEFNISRIVTKPVRGGIANVENCRLTPEENVSIMEKRSRENILIPFQHYLEEHPFLLEKKDESVKVRDVKSGLYGCEAGVNSFAITWDGRLIGCQMLGDCYTQPFEQGFLRAWDEFPEHVNVPPLPEPCKNCGIGCCACPATRLAETGHMGRLPQYICEEGKRMREMEQRLLAEMKFIVKKRRDHGENI